MPKLLIETLSSPAEITLRSLTSGIPGEIPTTRSSGATRYVSFSSEPSLAPEADFKCSARIAFSFVS
jgi:hypothetical protein